MEQEDFFDFTGLMHRTGPLVLRKNNVCGQRFYWRPCCWFKYTKTFGEILYKHSFKDDEVFLTFPLRRKTRRDSSFSIPSLKHAYDGPVPIASAKKRDLLCLLNVILTVYHNFYQSLKTSNIATDFDPDLGDIDPDAE